MTVSVMKIDRNRSNAASVSCHEGVLSEDLQRCFELTRKALQDRNESIARVTRSLDELAEIFDKAVTAYRKTIPVDRTN